MKYKVKPFILDRDLEEVLNEVVSDGGELYAVYRNSPNKAGEESSTVVYALHNHVDVEVKGIIEEFINAFSGDLRNFSQTGRGWADTFDIMIEKPLGWSSGEFDKLFMRLDEFIRRLEASDGVKKGEEKAKGDSEVTGSPVQPVDTEEGRE